MTRSYSIAFAFLLLGGCHLIFPFEVGDGQDAGSDGPAGDSPAFDKGQPDATTDTGSDGSGLPKLAWQKALGGTSADDSFKVAVDGSRNVYLTGAFLGVSDLGGGDVSSKGGSSDIFVTSFTADGAHRWQKTLGGTSHDYGYGVAVDGSGSVYLTGYFSGTADLGGGDVTSKGGKDVFLVKLGPSP